MQAHAGEMLDIRIGKCFGVFVLLVFVWIAIGARSVVAQTCTRGNFTATTPPGYKGTRGPKYQNVCVVPEGTAVAGCEMIDTDTMHSCAYRKNLKASASLPDAGKYASEMSAADADKIKPAIKMFIERYSAEICGSVKARTGDGRLQINAVYKDNETALKNYMIKSSAEFSGKLTSAGKEIEGHAEARNISVRNIANATDPGFLIAAVKEGKLMYCDLSKKPNANSVSNIIQSRANAGALVLGEALNEGTIGSKGKTQYEGIAKYGFESAAPRLVAKTCAAGGSAKANNMQTTVSLDQALAEIGKCLDAQGYSKTEKIPADKVVRIVATASSSSLNNTGNDAQNKPYCKKDFEWLSEIRARNALGVLKDYLSKNEYMTSQALNEVIPEEIITGTTKKTTSGKSTISYGGTNGDGTSGKCAYKISNPDTTDGKYLEVRDKDKAPDTDLDVAKFVHVSLNVAGKDEAVPKKEGAAILVTMPCKVLSLSCP